jgi:hypothetical protein
MGDVTAVQRVHRGAIGPLGASGAAAGNNNDSAAAAPRFDELAASTARVERRLDGCIRPDILGFC